MARFRLTAALAFFSAGLVCLLTLRQTPPDATTRQSSTRSASTTTSTTPAVLPLERRELLDASLHTSLIGSPVSEGASSLWKNDFNVVHVATTRFMQHQAKLENLGAARLDLFKTFTLPSFQQQSNQQLLWLIWTDANLNGPVLQEFLALVANIPNVVVIASEQVEDTNLRSLYGHSWTSLSESILSGNPRLVADYYKASHSHVLMETRLDADDALSHTFVESAQAQVAAAMGRGEYTQPGQVQHFCPESHVEWRYYKSSDVNAQDGQLIHFDDTNFCIYSGWTTAFHVEPENHSAGLGLSTFEPRALTASCEVVEQNECHGESSLDDLFSGNTVGPTSAPTPVDECKVVTFDVDALSRGDYVLNQFREEWGIEFSARPLHGCGFCWTPDITGEIDTEWGAVRVFDSYKAKGGWPECLWYENTTELGFPNANCADDELPDGLAPDGSTEWKKPGTEQAHENVCEPQGNLLILQDLFFPTPYGNKAASTTCPTACDVGGTMRIAFPNGADLISITFYNIDKSGGKKATMKVTSKSGVVTYDIPDTGPGGMTTMTIDHDDVTSFDIDFKGKFAVGDITYKWCPPESYTNLVCEQIIYDDFEDANHNNGWGNWIDGGTHASLTNVGLKQNDVNEATLEGNYVLLTHKKGKDSSIYTNMIDVKKYDYIQFTLDYHIKFFNGKEDFYIETSQNAGASWILQGKFVKDITFIDTVEGNINQAYTGTFKFQTFGIGSLSFRIRCDASNHLDYLYVDHVLIEGCTETDVPFPTQAPVANVPTQAPITDPPSMAPITDPPTKAPTSGELECRRQLRLVPQTLEQQQGRPPLTLPASVILARTPTAAGMKNVLPGKTGGGVRSARLSTFDGSGEGAVMDQKDAWKYMEQHFGVSRNAVVDTRKRLEGNMKKILVDAFAGQCTPGHSCKESTKKALGYLLDKAYTDQA